MRYLSAILIMAAGFMLSGCIIPYKSHIPVVKGRAIDASTRQPIPSAGVELAGFPATGTEADEDGNFATLPDEEWHIFSVPLSDRVDSYELMLTAPGYEPATRAFIVFRSSEVEVGEIELTPIPEQKQ